MLLRTESLTQESASANFTKEDPERQLAVSVLRLWIVMLSARNAWELSPKPLLLAAAPTDTSLMGDNVEAGRALGVLMIARKEL